MRRRTAAEQLTDKSQILDTFQVAAQLRGNEVHDLGRDVEGGGVDGDVHSISVNTDLPDLTVSDVIERKVQIRVTAFQVGGCGCSCAAQSEFVILVGGAC